MMLPAWAFILMVDYYAIQVGPFKTEQMCIDAREKVAKLYQRMSECYTVTLK